MRPLPIQTLPDTPTYVCGLAVVRGRPTPVVDLRVLLGDEAATTPKRLVSLRVDGERRVGLLVDDVLSVRDRHDFDVEALPPLLASAAADLVDELARLDGELVAVLHTACLVPDEVWARAPHTEDA